MAVAFDGGVVIGADSRTTTGSYIVRFRIILISWLLLYPNIANLSLPA